MKTIVFDGICLGDGPVTGVGRAFLTGLEAFAASTEHRCLLLLPTGTPGAEWAGVQTVAAPRGRLRRQLQLPGLLRALGADLLHSSVAAVPLGAPCPTIATVHDLPWLHAENGEHTSWWRRFATRRALHAASAILTPSTMTADDVRTLLGASQPMIRLVPNGCALGEEPSPTAVDARRGPLLVLGDDRPRKNHERLLLAHAEAAARCPTLPELQFVGPPAQYVSEAVKLNLLRTCRAVVHVAVFEGFGLPVLEALAHGAPVLSADLPPLREIAGEHAVYCDPRSIDAIAAGLERVHGDHALRRALARDGYERARAWQPTHIADRWRSVHDEVLR